jgi:spermidine synthase
VTADEADPDEGTAGGAVQFLADADRPGGWLLLIDRIRQSYVDLDDPTYLDFEYAQWFADVFDVLPAGPLAVTHVGGGACTLARYVGATRPGSTQIVLEPDEQLTALVRARLPFARGTKVRIRPVGGAQGIGALRDASADVLVLDAFAGGRVPAELTTVQFLREVARALTPQGVFVANVADGGFAGGGPVLYTRRLVAALRSVFADVLVRADPAVLKGRRFGNLVLAASSGDLQVAELARRAAGAMFPQRVVSGAELTELVRGAAPLTAADPMRSPAPPDEIWRVGG